MKKSAELLKSLEKVVKALYEARSVANGPIAYDEKGKFDYPDMDLEAFTGISVIQTQVRDLMDKLKVKQLELFNESS